MGAREFLAKGRENVERADTKAPRDVDRQLPQDALQAQLAHRNYTTLGYGDIVMSERWRLLGPQTAASGTLAFGWSTAAIVTVVIRLVRYRHRTQVRDESRGHSRETREPQSAHQ